MTGLARLLGRAFSSHLLSWVEGLCDQHEVANVLILKLPVPFHIVAPASAPVVQTPKVSASIIVGLVSRDRLCCD